MDAYDILKRKAAEKRDAAIKRARFEYRATIRRIASVARSIEPARAAKLPDKRAVRPAAAKPFRYMTPIQAASVVLGDGKALTIAEIIIEIQARGCRSEESPKVVAHTLRSSLSYHKARFIQGHDGRWSIAQGGADEAPNSPEKG